MNCHSMSGCTAKNVEYGYFVVRTVMPSPFLAKKWAYGYKAERKLRPTQFRPKGQKAAKRKTYINTYFGVLLLGALLLWVIRGPCIRGFQDIRGFRAFGRIEVGQSFFQPFSAFFAVAPNAVNTTVQTLPKMFAEAKRQTCHLKFCIGTQ